MTNNSQDRWIDKITIAGSATIIGLASSLVATILLVLKKLLPDSFSSLSESAIPLEFMSLFGICLLLWQISKNLKEINSKSSEINSKISEFNSKVSVIDALKETSNTHINLLYKLLPLASYNPIDSKKIIISPDIRIALLLLQSSTFNKLQSTQPGTDEVDALFWAEWGKYMIKKLKKIDLKLENNYKDAELLLNCYQEKQALLNHLYKARDELSLWVDKEWKYHFIRLLIGRIHYASLDDDKDLPLYWAVAIDEDIDNFNNGDPETKELLVKIPNPLRRFRRIFFIKDQKKFERFLKENKHNIIEQLKARIELRYCNQTRNISGCPEIAEIGIYSTIAFGRYKEDKSNIICFDHNRVAEWRRYYLEWWRQSEEIRSDNDGRLFLGKNEIILDTRMDN